MKIWSLVKSFLFGVFVVLCILYLHWKVVTVLILIFVGLAIAGGSMLLLKILQILLLVIVAMFTIALINEL